MNLCLPACVCFVAGYLCFCLVSGAVYVGTIKTETILGKTVKYCDYYGQKFLPVSTFKDYDRCLNCTCDEQWLTCQSIGASIIGNEDCDNVQVGCSDNVWVLKDYPTQICPPHLIPRIFSSVGK